MERASNLFILVPVAVICTVCIIQVVVEVEQKQKERLEAIHKEVKLLKRGCNITHIYSGHEDETN